MLGNSMTQYEQKEKTQNVAFFSRQDESHRARLKGKGWREGCWLEFLKRSLPSSVLHV